MYFLWYLLIGLVAGWLAGLIVKGRGAGFLVNLAVGVIGGLLGGWLFSLLGLVAVGTLGSLLTSLAGAVVLLWLVALLTPRSRKELRPLTRPRPHYRPTRRPPFRRFAARHGQSRRKDLHTANETHGTACPENEPSKASPHRKRKPGTSKNGAVRSLPAPRTERTARSAPKTEPSKASPPRKRKPGASENDRTKPPRPKREGRPPKTQKTRC